MRKISIGILAAVLMSSTYAQVAIKVAPPEERVVKNETITLKIPSRGWGNIFPRLTMFGVPIGEALVPGKVSISIKGQKLKESKDYKIDYLWSRINPIPKSSLKNGDKLSVNYTYRLRRIDSLVKNSDGSEIVVKGKSDLTQPVPPQISEGQKRLSNIFIDLDGKVTEFPIKSTVQKAKTATTMERIPITLDKIKSGKQVKIVCWGDSVTAGGDANRGNAYPSVLARKLKEKFPSAKIEVKVVAYGGSSSTHWLWPKTYPYGTCDWARVVKEKPDLIILEFVNDVGLKSEKSLFSHYSEILKRVKKLNSELILIAPHFTSLKMMGIKSLKDKESRPYVYNLKKFAEKNKLGLADASARWEHLAVEGIPYITLLCNSLNHPNDRGHQIFAEELIKNFESDSSVAIHDQKQVSRGLKWIHEHPFQIGAFVEGGIRHYRDIGFNTIVNYYSLKRRKLSQGLMSFASRHEIPWFTFYRWNMKSNDEEFIKLFVDDRKKYSGNIGVLIGDENKDSDFARLAPLLDKARKISPDLLVSHCARGVDLDANYIKPGKYQAYINKLVTVLKPDMVNFNMYPFYIQKNNHGLAASYFRNLEIVTSRARKAGIPCFNWLQGFAFQETKKWPHHAPSESELRMQAFTSLAYGMKGFFYWTYSSHYSPYGKTILDKKGNLSNIGKNLKTIIPELKIIGTVTKQLNDKGAYYVASQHLDKKSGKLKKHIPWQVKLLSKPRMPIIQKASVSNAVWGFLIGDFTDNNSKQYIMVVNCNFAYKKNATDTAGKINIQFVKKVKSLDRLNRKTGKFERIYLDKNNSLNDYILPGGTGDLFKINH